MSVKCICCLCGREVEEDEELVEVGEEMWCADCAYPKTEGADDEEENAV